MHKVSKRLFTCIKCPLFFWYTNAKRKTKGPHSLAPQKEGATVVIRQKGEGGRRRRVQHLQTRSSMGSHLGQQIRNSIPFPESMLQDNNPVSIYNLLDK